MKAKKAAFCNLYCSCITNWVQCFPTNRLNYAKNHNEIKVFAIIDSWPRLTFNKKYKYEKNSSHETFTWKKTKADIQK